MTASISLRPVDLDRDFHHIAALFTSEQGEPTTIHGLREDYEAHKERILSLMVATNESGELFGFNWATRSRSDPGEADIYVIVRPERRRQGAGGLLYANLEQSAAAAGVNRLKVDLRDNCPECRAFAERYGFIERKHLIGMTLDLAVLEDQPYDAGIDLLRSEGFCFTSMEALGNTEEAQRRLYALNDTTSSETPGSEGEHSWLSFEDFQERVCRANWYRPAGQMVVIDTATGDWVAMSAITRFEGADYAYNLFTGVDRRYRGRKLGQSVKVLALRYAREALEVGTVRTHHNVINAPIIAIDRKFGYVQSPGIVTMEKVLDVAREG